ncbi:MAG: DNA-binding protein [Flavipsychrobacter sp.]|jgi:uncharacterized protein (UPF0332 family)|nr:DNA-binding protein [Flavipsychrobacter sp.]
MNDHERIKLAGYRLNNAKRTLKEAELLINNMMWNAAVNRIYYACFYAVIGLLISKKIQAKKHSGVIQMFSLHCVQTGLLSREYGKFYTAIFDMRQSGDYSDYIDFEEKEVTVLLAPAKNFIEQIEKCISNQTASNG